MNITVVYHILSYSYSVINKKSTYSSTNKSKIPQKHKACKM